MGDEVMISTENLVLKLGKMKLVPKYVRPLEVMKRLAHGIAYQLCMPKELRAIQDTFYISLLERYVPHQFNRNKLKCDFEGLEARTLLASRSFSSHKFSIFKDECRIEWDKL